MQVTVIKNNFYKTLISLHEKVIVDYNFLLDFFVKPTKVELNKFFF